MSENEDQSLRIVEYDSEENEVGLVRHTTSIIALQVDELSLTLRGFMNLPTVFIEVTSN